jgi:N-acetyl-gamma-glutamylphosphate reductase
VSDSIPAIVLGGTGYVAGELLRLIAGHPRLKAAAILSDSQPGAFGGRRLPSFAQRLPGPGLQQLDQIDALVRETPRCALFSAAPHGVAAAIIDRLLSAAENAGTQVHCVDISADFRYTSAAPMKRYTSMRTARRRASHNSPAPFPSTCKKSPTPHVAHPGLLRHRDSARQCAPARVGSDRLAAVRHRHHRQHRFGAPPGGRHASPATA